MLEEGIYLYVTTKTVDDTFGNVVYLVDEIKNARVFLTMQGGSGPSARPGYRVQDNIVEVKHGIASGAFKVIPKHEAEAMIKVFNSKGTPGSVGGMEVDY